MKHVSNLNIHDGELPAKGRLRRLRGGTAAALFLAGVMGAPSHGQGQSLAPAAALPAAEVRPAPPSLDMRVRRLEESLGTIDERMRAGGLPGVPVERLALALLHLETVVDSGRPWAREWRLILALDGATLVPQIHLEVLGSHAARGLPSSRELAERFEVLAPAIAARAASEREFLERGMNAVRATLAGIGLLAPVEPSQVDTVLASIREHLRRGELPGALAEVATLAEAQQVLLAGWLAQMRARVAVDQSLQEAILGLLSGAARQG